MSVYGCNMNLELQQRAVEYNAVIREHANLRDGLFETMPALEMKVNQAYTNGFNGDGLAEEVLTQEEIHEQQIKQQQEAAKTLLNIFSDDAPSQATSATTPTPQTHTNIDLLDGLFDASNVPSTPVLNPSSRSNPIDLMGGDLLTDSVPMSPSQGKKSEDIFDILSSPTAQSAAVNSSNMNDLNDLLGLNSSFSTPQPVKATNSSNDMFDFFSAPNPSVSKPSTSLVNSPKKAPLQVTAYEKNNVKIVFEPTVSGKDNTSPGQHFISMVASNMSVSENVNEFLFGVAVPKSMQMQLSQPSTSVIQPFDSMQQTIAINNPTKVGQE